MEDEQEWLQREECDFLSLDHGNSKVLSWFTDSFDQLVTTRDNILSNIMEEHAHDDITDFKVSSKTLTIRKYPCTYNSLCYNNRNTLEKR